MPIYDYKCNSCNHTSELILRYDDPSPRCEICNSTMTRQLSNIGAYKMEGSTSTGLTKSTKRDGK